jgi:collagen type I/II/III/V/XI/XXIV/XXVII alpha
LTAQATTAEGIINAMITSGTVTADGSTELLGTAEMGIVASGNSKPEDGGWAQAGGLVAYSPGGSVQAAFSAPGAVVFGTGSMGEGETSTAAGAEVFNGSVNYDVATASLPSENVSLGLVGTAAGSDSFASLTVSATLQGTMVLDQSFTSITNAESFLTNDLINLGALVPSGGTVDVIVSLSETLNAASNELYGFNFELGVTCFGPGTFIRTTAGDRAVETLREGDLLLTASGETAPVVFLGRRRIDCRRHKRPGDVQPIRVRAGAFGEAMPARDLLLSPDHAVFVDGVLIPVRHLLNGTTIARVLVDTITYYHVELPEHDVIFAEGLTVESYLDTGDRATFENSGAVVTMHARFTDRLREAGACAPLIVHGPALAAARAKLAVRGDTRVRPARAA